MSPRKRGSGHTSSGGGVGVIIDITFFCRSTSLFAWWGHFLTSSILMGRGGNNNNSSRAIESDISRAASCVSDFTDVRRRDSVWAGQKGRRIENFVCAIVYTAHIYIFGRAREGKFSRPCSGSEKNKYSMYVFPSNSRLLFLRIAKKGGGGGGGIRGTIITPAWPGVPPKWVPKTYLFSFAAEWLRAEAPAWGVSSWNEIRRDGVNKIT